MIRTPRWRRPVAAAVALAALLAACGGDDGGSSDEATTAAPSATTAAAGGDTSATTAAATDGEKTKVTIQLGWVPVAEYAEYYAAQKMGYYDALGLDVTVLPGGPNIATAQIVASGQAQFGTQSLGSTLASNEAGTELISISQSYERMSFVMVTHKEDNITSVEQWKGKKIGMFSGNQRVYATLAKYGLDPDRDVTLVDQGFDMNLFLNHEIDVASAYSYGELGQVYAAGLTPDDINILNFTDEGTDNVEAQLYVSKEFLEENRDAAVKVLAGSLQGMLYCRDNPEECVDFVLEASPTLERNTELYEMSVINELRWPSELGGVGKIDEAFYQRSAKLLADYEVLQELPDPASYYDTTLYPEAVALLPEGTDLVAADFTPPAFDLSILTGS